MIKKMFVVLLLILLLFSACAKKEAPAEKKVFKVAMLTSGPVNDGGWNAAAYQGLMDISEKLGFETAYTENVAVADIEAGYIDKVHLQIVPATRPAGP